jgi:hypothetical protein
VEQKIEKFLKLGANECIFLFGIEIPRMSSEKISEIKYSNNNKKIAKRFLIKDINYASTVDGNGILVSWKRIKLDSFYEHELVELDKNSKIVDIPQNYLSFEKFLNNFCETVKQMDGYARFIDIVDTVKHGLLFRLNTGEKTEDIFFEFCNMVSSEIGSIISDILYINKHIDDAKKFKEEMSLIFRKIYEEYSNKQGNDALDSFIWIGENPVL